MLKLQATRTWVPWLVIAFVVGGCEGWPAPAAAPQSPAPAVTATRQFMAVPPDASGATAVARPTPSAALTAPPQPTVTATLPSLPAPPAAIAPPTVAPAAASGQGPPLIPQATAPHMPSPTPSSPPGVTDQALATGASAAPGTQHPDRTAGRQGPHRGDRHPARLRSRSDAPAGGSGRHAHRPAQPGQHHGLADASQPLRATRPLDMTKPDHTRSGFLSCSDEQRSRVFVLHWRLTA